MSLRDEILEQPEALRRLIRTQWTTIQAIAREIKHRVDRGDIDYVYLTGRGTSDHAGHYAQYLQGSANRLPVALATPLLFSVYQQPLQLRHAPVVGISQSGSHRHHQGDRRGPTAGAPTPRSPRGAVTSASADRSMPPQDWRSTSPRRSRTRRSWRSWLSHQ